MKPPRPPAAAGFALIIVLWTIVLLSLLVAHIENFGRDEAQRALNLRRAAALQAQADGAVAVAAFHLLDPTAAAWRADGRPYAILVTDDDFTTRISVRAETLAGKVDLNSAPVALLQALLTACGADAASAAMVAGNIAAWRFPFGGGAAADAAMAPYKAAALPYGPPGTPFESTDELGLVLGVTPSILAALQPHVTVYHQGMPAPAAADPVVARALASTIIPIPAAPAGLQEVALTATAYGADGSQFTRQAIVQLGGQDGGWMNVLTWTAP